MAEEPRKGLFTQEQEDFLSKVLDDFFKFKNPLLETFDKPVFRIIIQTADNTGFDKLNEKWKNELIPIIDAAIVLDVEMVRQLTVSFLNRTIDVPALDEELEFVVFDTFASFIVASLNWYVVKTTNELKTKKSS